MTPADHPAAPMFRSAATGLWHHSPAASGTVDKIMVGPRRRHLALPPGAEILGPTRAMLSGDQAANVIRGAWESIDQEDVGIAAGIYDVVIRPAIPQQVQHDRPIAGE